MFRLVRADERAGPASAGDGSPAEAETPNKETTLEVVAAEGHPVDEFVIPGARNWVRLTGVSVRWRDCS